MKYYLVSVELVHVIIFWSISHNLHSQEFIVKAKEMCRQLSRITAASVWAGVMQALFDCLALHHLGRVVANTVHYQLASSPLQNSTATVCLSSSGRKGWTAVTGVSVSVPAVRVDFRATGVSLTLCGCFQEKYSQRRADVLGWRQQGIAEHTEVRAACVHTRICALIVSLIFSFMIQSRDSFN